MGRCRCQDMGIWPSKSRRLLVNRCKKPQDNCLVRILFPDPKLPRIDGPNHRLKHRLERTKVDEGTAEIDRPIRDFDNHIETGFQLATFQGPLCGEPVVGMAYFVEQVDIDIKSLESEIGKSHNSQTLPSSSPSTLHLEQNRTQQITGSFVSSFKDACRNALLDWSPRLLLAMYSCEIQASSRFRFSMFAPSLSHRP
jgi:ribosome assembly protein 1